MRIQHNIMAMNAYRNYTNNTSALSSNLEKLSSGYKINRAGDDAAGLAISEKMRAQITGLDQAADNVKDGISLVKTAEGALQEVQDMLNRMVELATQSANGTYEDSVDRKNLQSEVDQLTTEINRIADSANFNGIKLLDGSMTTADAVADVPSYTSTAVFDSLSSEDLQSLLLPEADEGTAAAVGTNTILETDASDNDGSGNGVSLNGVTHVIKDTSKDITDTGYYMTLTIGAATIQVSDKYLADNYGFKVGDTVSSKDLAQAFVDKSGGTLTDGTNTYNVKRDGDSVKLIATNNLDTDTNRHLTVKLDGATSTQVAGVGAAVGYKLTAGTAAAKGTGTVDPEKDAAVQITAEIDGKTLTFTVGGFDSSQITAANVLAKIDRTIVGYDEDGNIATNDEGDQYRFVDYFTAATGQTTAAGDSLVLTNKAATADGDGNKILGLSISGQTLNTGNTADTLATATKTDDLTVEGADPYWNGTLGTANVGTQNIIMSTVSTKDQLANTTIDLSKDLTDGTQIKLGNTTYTIAIGEDSIFKDAENVVYLASVNKDETKALAEIASKLTEVAKDNKEFTVGQGATAGKITLQQKAEVKGSTDMSTMKNLLGYLGVSHFNADASDAAAAEAQKAYDDAVAANAGKAPLTLQIGDTSDSYNQMEVKINDMHANAIGSTDADGNLTSIADISISTAEDAQAAVSVIKDAINQVSSTRGDLGAIQNRLEHTSNNLSVMSENIQDAESTIRDTDIAEEMMSYTKNNILVQSAQAMLAQANQVPQGVLQLLQ